MSSSKNSDSCQDLIRVIPLGAEGYDVTVGYNGYSFDVFSGREVLTFRMNNEAQVDELEQVLEGILEAVKTARMKKNVLSSLDQRIEAILERKLRDKDWE